MQTATSEKDETTAHSHSAEKSLEEENSKDSQNKTLVNAPISQS